jgi:hypothetical protein
MDTASPPVNRINLLPEAFARAMAAFEPKPPVTLARYTDRVREALRDPDLATRRLAAAARAWRGHRFSYQDANGEPVLDDHETIAKVLLGLHAAALEDDEAEAGVKILPATVDRLIAAVADRIRQHPASVATAMVTPPQTMPDASTAATGNADLAAETWDVQTTAAYIGCEPRTVYKLYHAGILRGTRPGVGRGRVSIYPASAVEYRRKRENGPGVEPPETTRAATAATPSPPVGPTVPPVSPAAGQNSTGRRKARSEQPGLRYLHL